jgi:hypothetical protein
MVMLADHYDFVIGGDPDRDTIDLAVIETRTGGVTAQIAEAADGTGYQRLLDWGRAHAPGRRVWSLEGTASFASGLSLVSPKPVKTWLRLAASSEREERRTTGSMRCAQPAMPWRPSSMPRLGHEGCERHFAWS